ncbi:MAG: pseudaminic acid synthase [Clostridium sp.]|nr:pseudaminic acid synthase [Clostridium sp.]
MIKIQDRIIDKKAPTFVIAEVSGNHKGKSEIAKEIIEAAAEAGADAVKLQTYTPDTITLDCDNEYFQITQGTLWDGRTLHNLYEEAYTPWEWHKELVEYAHSLGLICFSSPFDLTAVDLLEELEVPAYKIASFEINDIRLIEYVASKGKPIIMSTGVATMGEIEEAIAACKRMGNEQIILLKCCSAYPTPMEDVNLRTIPNMAETFDSIVGLSDHSLGHTVALGAVALGAKVVEKHLCLSRKDGSVDSAFSMEPQEFKEMVHAIRDLEKALGKVTYELTDKQKASTAHKRSLFVSEDIKAGEVFTDANIKSVRPSNGLNTKYYKDFIGKVAREDIKKGTPLDWHMI